jgi:hypothetical protein
MLKFSENSVQNMFKLPVAGVAMVRQAHQPQLKQQQRAKPIS